MGESRERTDWFGNKYTEHFDSSGKKTGESHERTDWFGNDYTEHSDTTGKKTGESHERTDWFGNDYTKNSDTSGKKTGESHERTDWFGNDYTEHSGSGGYGKTKSRTNTSTKTSRIKGVSNSGGYSGGGGGSESEGGCGCSLMFVAIIIIAVIGSILSNSRSDKFQAMNNPSNNKTKKSDNYYSVQNVNSYFDEKFMVSADGVSIDGEKTIVNLTLKNLVNVKSKVLFSSGKSISNFGREQFVRSPYLSDEQGNEYLVIQPAIRGEAKNHISFDDAGWGGSSTIKVWLPPNASVSAHLIFPKLNGNVRNVTLTIPGIAGWQTDIVIPKLKVTFLKSFQHISNDSLQEHTRSSTEANSVYVNHGVRINHAGVAEELTNDGNPLGEANVFRGNDKYDLNNRVYVIYFAKFSGAIPERTRFIAKMFCNGSEDLYLHHFPEIVAKGRNGTYSSRTGPYYLATGVWEIRLFADDQEVSRTRFEIVSGQ